MVNLPEEEGLAKAEVLPKTLRLTLDDGVLLPRPMFPNIAGEPNALEGDATAGAAPPTPPAAFPLPPKMDLLAWGVPNDELPNRDCTGAAGVAAAVEAGRDAPINDDWPKTFFDIGAGEAAEEAAAAGFWAPNSGAGEAAGVPAAVAVLLTGLPNADEPNTTNKQTKI